MELVGTEVKKRFPGLDATVAGVVESYDAAAGYFEIRYEDGDSEELDFDEVAAILDEMGAPAPKVEAPPPRRSRRSRRPKKRRRSELNLGGRVLGEGVSEEESKGLKESGGHFEVSGEIRVNGSGLELEGRADSKFGEKISEGNASSEEIKDVRMEDLVLGERSAEVRKFENQEGETKEEGDGPKERRRLSGKAKFTPETTPLRRSARRARASLLSTPEPDSCEVVFGSGCKIVFGSGNAKLGEKGAPLVAENSTKPALPPSSGDLDIDGLAVLDLFSVYTCLRSFSRLLFLSPFRLEAFLAALRSKYANYLIDSIHFAILQTLRPHLEFLADEGSESAKDCLRSLNWQLLDLVTWPVFLAEYLLVHGSQIKPAFKLSHLELLDGEYYKQPAGVKLEILRCLCDDVIEVESIRSELNRRIVESEMNMDVSYNTSIEKRRKDSATTDQGGFAGQEVFEETADGNSDECCLCRMDGNLICCDGCPAAFHSRCVGVAKDLLPEGEWYCPECSMEQGDGLAKLSKPFHGAEILGIDPDGRIYFGSCGRLLVSDSCETDALYHYYNKIDSDAVVKVLKSYPSYNAIVRAISTYWRSIDDASFCVRQHGNGFQNVHEVLSQQVHSKPFSSTRQEGFSDIEMPSMEISAASQQCAPQSSEVMNLVNLVSSNHACPESFDEIVQAATSVRRSGQTAIDCNMGLASAAKEVGSFKPVGLGDGLENGSGFPGWGCMPLATVRRRGGAPSLQSDPLSYVNYYSFGCIASSIAVELHKSSHNNNKEAKKSVEDIKSAQLKAISRKSVKFCWYTYQKLSVDAQKESCGWCFSCRTSSENDCLFKVSDDKHLENLKNRAVGVRSEKNKKSHIVSAIHHILSIEEHVHSLLSGPWENPHYSQHWRKAVLKASDVASLKTLLLMLEINLRHVVLSVEWLKPVDSAFIVGSASIMLTSAVPAALNCGGSRKQAKRSSGDDSFMSHAVTTSDMYWWRGGKLSRQVFHWNILPWSLSSKGGRQAGCRKIPNILYPDGVELAKPRKYIAWRAAVEMSKSVAQLIYQVKDFDLNIKWKELLTTRLFPQLSKESKKARPVKWVTILRKCIEEAQVKYLLEFGKKEMIPTIVSKHGVFLEESSKGRKRYWLNEAHVPLNLLKAFEEKKVAQLLRKTSSGSFSEKENKSTINRHKRSNGLSCLLSREQISGKQLCGHCSKDVLTREAVNCQFCDGFFHKKHFRVPKGAITTIYTCCNCKDKENTKVKSRGHKVLSKKGKLLKGKKSQGIPKKILEGKKSQSIQKKILEGRRSQRIQQKISKGKISLATLKKGKRVIVKSKKKLSGLKRGNQHKSKGGRPEKSETDVSWRKRKRSVVLHSYWLNGLLWSRKPVNEQGRDFRERKVILSSQDIKDHSIRPTCALCGEEYKSGVIYVGCETCEDWFHGDIFCLTLENISNLIGFKCHKCLMKNRPMCPFPKNIMIDEVQIDRDHHTDAMDAEHQNRLHAGENFLATVHHNDPPGEEQGENVIHMDKASVIHHKILSTNGFIAHSPEHAETNYGSTTHRDGTGLVISDKVDERLNQKMKVPDLLVAAALADPAESQSVNISTKVG